MIEAAAPTNRRLLAALWIGIALHLVGDVIDLRWHSAHDVETALESWGEPARGALAAADRYAGRACRGRAGGQERFNDGCVLVRARHGLAVRGKFDLAWLGTRERKRSRPASLSPCDQQGRDGGGSGVGDGGRPPLSIGCRAIHARARIGPRGRDT